MGLCDAGASDDLSSGDFVYRTYAHISDPSVLAASFRPPPVVDDNCYRQALYGECGGSYLQEGTIEWLLLLSGFGGSTDGRALV